MEGFLSATVTAHEADILYMRNPLEEITKKKYKQAGLTLEDLKPDTLERNEMSFRQWSSNGFIKILKRCCGLHRCKSGTSTSSLPKVRKNFDWELIWLPSLTHIYLAMKRLTASIAREIQDTSKTGGEFWCRLTHRFYGRNVQGATAIATQLQELKGPSQIEESLHFLNVIRKFFREFA